MFYAHEHLTSVLVYSVSSLSNLMRQDNLTLTVTNQKLVWSGLSTILISHGCVGVWGGQYPQRPAVRGRVPLGQVRLHPIF